MALRVNRIEQIVFPITPPSPPAAGGDVFVQQRPLSNQTGGTTPANAVKEWFAAFADNNTSGVPVGKIVEWRRNDGTTVIPSQADNYSYYASGRLKFASFTGQLPSYTAGATDTLKGYAKTGTWNNTSHGTTSLITARDIRMEITISGVTYTLGANNEVTRGTSIQQVRSGPRSASWRLWGEFRNGTTGASTAQGIVWGMMYLTFFSDGTYKAWGTIYSSRMTTGTTANVSVTDYKLKDYVGPTTLFDYATAFTMYPAEPIYCVNADGLHPYSGTSVDKLMIYYPGFTLADPTTTGLYDAMVLWWHKTTATSIANIGTTGSGFNYIPQRAADYNSINQAGGNSWVGPITEYAFASLFGGNWNNFRADRINAFDFACAHTSYLDVVTGYPANLSNTNYTGLPAHNAPLGWGAGGTVIGGSGTGNPNVDTTPADGSHAPLYAWCQYIMTGEEHWLDMMHDNTVGQQGWNDPSIGSDPRYRNPFINGNQYYGIVGALNNQTRALAWNTRNFCNSQWVTPDAHPMKPYLLGAITSTFAALADYVTPPCTGAGAATLGVYDGGEDGTGANSTWMHDYLLMMMAQCVRRGRVAASQGFIAHHLVKYVLGRAANGCMYSTSQYQTGIAAGQDSATWSLGPQTGGMTYPQNWGEVWTGGPNSNTIGALGFIGPVTNMLGTGCPAGVSDLIDGAGGHATPINYLYGLCHSYPNIQQGAAACAQIAGITGGSTVYTYFLNYEAGLGLTEADWGAVYGGRLRIKVPA